MGGANAFKLFVSTEQTNMLLITTCPPMLAKFKPSLVKLTQHPSPCEMSSSLNRPDDAARIERERERERERETQRK